MWWNAGGWVEMLFWAPACSDVQTADVQISNLGQGQPIETVAFHLESAVQSCLKELKISCRKQK